jgi:hypothetical protein
MNREIDNTIAIFGAKCALGQTVNSEMIKLGFNVIQYSSSANLDDGTRFFDLYEPVLPLKPDFRYAFYLSWSTKRDEFNQKASFISAQYFSTWCLEMNVKPIFISSLAAKKDFPSSNYGRYKKDAENEFLSREQGVFSPGTIIFETNPGGSAVSELLSISQIQKRFFSLFIPIRVPIVYEKSMLVEISKILDKKMVQSKYIFVDEWTSLQKLLNVNVGKLSIAIIKPLIVILPITKRDRLLSLFDLQV